MSLEENNPFDYFDALYCINLDRRADRWQSLQKELVSLGIDKRVVRFSAIETPENGHIGCMLSHRAIIKDAQLRGWKNILIFEDDIFFRKDSHYFSQIFSELIRLENSWSLFYFGGFLRPYRGREATIVHKLSKHIGEVQNIICTHAIVYNQNFYKIFLDEIPEDLERSRDFIKKWTHFDTWLVSKQKKYTALYDVGFSIFQRRSDSDTDGKSTRWSYYKQYFYILFQYKILWYLLFLPVTIFNSFIKLVNIFK